MRKAVRGREGHKAAFSSRKAVREIERGRELHFCLAFRRQKNYPAELEVCRRTTEEWQKIPYCWALYHKIISLELIRSSEICDTKLKNLWKFLRISFLESSCGRRMTGDEKISGGECGNWNPCLFFHVSDKILVRLRHLLNRMDFLSFWFF